MPAPVIAAGIGAAGALGSAALGKGKKTAYTSGRSPQAQGIENQMAQYISGGLGKPTAYANVNPASIMAMDMLSRMFFGQGYSNPQYGMSAPGGGPTGMGMPPGYGQYGAPQVNMNSRNFPASGLPPQIGGMPTQLGPQMPQRQFYGGGFRGPQGIR